MSPSALRKYESLHGYPCPRRVLKPDNAGAYRLVTLHMAEMDAFVAPTLEVLCCSDQERWDITGRVLRAITDPEVQKLLYPPKDEASR